MAQSTDKNLRTNNFLLLPKGDNFLFFLFLKRHTNYRSDLHTSYLTLRVCLQMQYAERLFLLFAYKAACPLNMF